MSLHRLRALIWKDMKLELRESSDVLVKVGFAAASGILTGAVASYSEEPSYVVAGALVIFMVMAALFEAYASFIRESLTGTLDGLRSSPLPGWILMLSKAILSSLWILLGLLVFMIVADAFTIGLDPSWLPLSLWIAAGSIFTGSVSSYISASLAHGEVRAGGVALLVLSISIPFLHAAINPLTISLSGVYPSLSELLSILLAAVGYAGFIVVLGGVAIE